MFVTKTKYAKLLAESQALAHYSRILCDQLVIARARIDKLKSAPSATFNGSDIDSLIRLCHPDRHGGSEASTRMTQKLLALRKPKETKR